MSPLGPRFAADTAPVRRHHGRRGIIMVRRDWEFDESKQLGPGFTIAAEVAGHDPRQRVPIEEDRALLDDLAPAAGADLADLGCGTGQFACEAARRVRSVLAVDISQPLLDAARRRAESQGLANIRFQPAGFLSWEAPDAPLDMIVSKFALHHLPDFWKAAALRRMFEALKPGGRLFIRDVVFSCSPDEIEATVATWMSWIETATGYSRADAARHLREEHSTFGWVMEGLLAAAGFRVIRSEYDPGGIYADYLAIKPKHARPGILPEDPEAA
jgi:ubiquinone/menaquinone biosynthesis C-methylase UbiE